MLATCNAYRTHRHGSESPCRIPMNTQGQRTGQPPRRAPLIRSASLPGALREVNSKGVVGQSTVPTGSQVGTGRPTTHLRPSTPQTTMGIQVRHGWAGGFGHKQCPKTRGSLRADAETTSQTATRRLPASLIHMNARMCACMHSQLHTKVPDLTSDDTGSPPYGVCHHLLVDSARYSSRVPVVPALARALPRASCGLSFCLAPYRAPSLRPEPRGLVTGPTSCLRAWRVDRDGHTTSKQRSKQTNKQAIEDCYGWPIGALHDRAALS